MYAIAAACVLSDVDLVDFAKYMHPWRNDRSDRHRNRFG